MITVYDHVWFLKEEMFANILLRARSLASYTRSQLNLVSRKINKIPRYQISVASSTNQPNSEYLNTIA